MFKESLLALGDGLSGSKRDITPYDSKQQFDKYFKVHDSFQHSNYSEFVDKYEPVRKALAIISENPDILENMPILPTSDSDSIIEKREILLRSNVDVDDDAVAEFLEKLGGVSLDTNINLDDLSAFVKIDDNFYYSKVDEYSFDFDNGEDVGYISVRKMLELIRVRTFGDQYITNQYKKANENIRNYAPELMPVNPVVAVFDVGLGGRARYMGEVGGKHYIVSEASGLQDNPYISLESYPEDTSSIEHEMIHAFHEEIVGNVFFGFKISFDDMVEIEGGDSPNRIIRKMDDSMYDVPDEKIATQNYLQISVAEGSAMLGQLYLYNQKIENSTDFDEEMELIKMRRNFLARLRFRDNVNDVKYDAEHIGMMSVYRDGINLLKPLYKEFGLDNIVGIIKDIDYVKLGEIEEDSVEYNAIISDPRLMPGLADNSLVKESLENNPPAQVSEEIEKQETLDKPLTKFQQDALDQMNGAVEADRLWLHAGYIKDISSIVSEGGISSPNARINNGYADRETTNSRLPGNPQDNGLFFFADTHPGAGTYTHPKYGNTDLIFVYPPSVLAKNGHLGRVADVASDNRQEYFVTNSLSSINEDSLTDTVDDITTVSLEDGYIVVDFRKYDEVKKILLEKFSQSWIDEHLISLEHESIPQYEDLETYLSVLEIWEPVDRSLNWKIPEEHESFNSVWFDQREEILVGIRDRAQMGVVTVAPARGDSARIFKAEVNINEISVVDSDNSILTQEQKTQKIDKLNQASFSAIDDDEPITQGISSHQYASIDRLILSVKYHDMPVYMKVVSIDRNTAISHRESNTYNITMKKIADAAGGVVDVDNPDLSSFSYDVQQEMRREIKNNSEMNALLLKENSLSRMSILVYARNDVSGENINLGYSDIEIYEDNVGEIIVEAPAYSFNLGGDRSTSDKKFQGSLANTLNTRTDLKQVGLGQLLVEVGSTIAAKRYGATKRVFSKDATDRGEGSFYINKMGAEMTKRVPYGQKEEKDIPVMGISSDFNEQRTWPFFTDVVWK